MIVIENILVSEELVQQEFVCNLTACKGACCWEGEYGAPVKKEEILEIKKNLDNIIPFLSKKSQQILQDKGVVEYFDNAELWGTPVHEEGPCVYLIYNELGIAKCGIEKAWEEGRSTFRKPISCHLYPLRVNKNDELGFEAWNYERWDICSAACTNGKKLRVPLYVFLKEAIIRYKGTDFYEELCASAAYLNADNEDKD